MSELQSIKSISRRSAIVLGAACAMALPMAAYGSVDTGTPAPDFTLMDSNGNAVTLSDYADKTVVLEWTNHDCPYVVMHYKGGNMQSLQTKATDDGVVWMSIVSSAPGKQGHVSGADANELTESRNAAPSYVLLDESGDVGRLYGATNTPHMYVIDKGTLKYQGAIDDWKRGKDVAETNNYVTAALTSISNGEAIAVPSKKAYGCSIKY